MKIFFLIWFTWFAYCTYAQDSTVKKQSWALSGYIKDLEWVRFDKDFKHSAFTNLLHNRINLKWNPGEKWSGRIELRNRLYWGDDVHSLPGFKKHLDNQSETVNASYIWFSTRSAILHSNIERFWMEYKNSKSNIRAGRQRINWGITNTWNPNDIFNSYNFLDFDYEERPGSDAVKAQYLTGDLSHIELAAAATSNRPIIAAKYITNYRKYDIQWNAGLYQNIFTAGIGWAGSMKDVGFKGEAQFYAGGDSLSQLLLVMETDYIFKNGWYISSAFMYNQKGIKGPLNDWTKLDFQASPRSLMPTKWNLLVGSTKEFTPIFSGSMNLVYAPGTNLLILFPSLRYNLKTNWDLDFVWQSFFAETNRFEAISHTGYLRLRWSF